MKKVLIITFWFPPSPATGGVRIRGIAKYLPEFGWEPVVLTPKLPGKPSVSCRVIQTPYPGDVTILLEQRLRFFKIKRQVGSYQDQKQWRDTDNILVKIIRRFLAYPDEQRYWYPFALKAGEDLFKKERFDAIISSSKPAVCHLIAKKLKEKFNVPWLADYRDLWTQAYNYPYTFIRLFFERRLEKKTISVADVLTTVSDPLAKKLRELHFKKPVFVIPNGYDPDEINLGFTTLRNKFSITYTGTIYRGKQDLSLFLLALSRVISQGKIKKEEVEFRYFGIINDRLKQHLNHIIDYYGLRDVVVWGGYIPRDEALKKQRESQVLLLLCWNDPRQKGVYTSKLFDYLASRRPILAVGGYKDVVSDLLEKTKAGVHAVTLPEIEFWLLEYYKQFKTYGYVLYNPNQEEIAKYSHREMTKKFKEALKFILLNSRACPKNVKNIFLMGEGIFYKIRA